MFAAPYAAPQALEAIAVPANLRVLVLAPHPDDFDAIGATLRHLRARGAVIHLAVLTSGASGVEDGFHGATTDTAKAALREAEQAASCAFFGLAPERLRFLRLAPDDNGNPRLDGGNRDLMRERLRAVRPHIVCMPHGNDSNITHQRTYALFRAVALEERLEAWALLNQDAKTVAMRTDLYLPFDEDTARWKAELLRLHLSQHQRNLNTRGKGFDERVLAVNRKIAADLAIAAPYAEAFELEYVA